MQEIPKGGARRRGRPPLPKDNETRERLLDSALRLFAERGITQVGVRDITEAAGQSVGTLNYHFGSKENLVIALVRRSAPRLLEERLALLRQIEEQSGTERRLRAILYALLALVIRWSRQEETQRLFLPFLNRVRLDGPAEVRSLIESETRHLRPFEQALAALLPDLSEAEIGWRLHFVLGIEHAIHNEAARLKSLIGGGEEELGEAESITQRVIDFVVPGWLAASNSGALEKPSNDGDAPG